MSFDYKTWALRTAAACLNCDISCGFEVADNTPDRDKATAEVQKIIQRLEREADKRDPERKI